MFQGFSHLPLNLRNNKQKKNEITLHYGAHTIQHYDNHIANTYKNEFRVCDAACCLVTRTTLTKSPRGVHTFASVSIRLTITISATDSVARRCVRDFCTANDWSQFYFFSCPDLGNAINIFGYSVFLIRQLAHRKFIYQFSSFFSFSGSLFYSFLSNKSMSSECLEKCRWRMSVLANERKTNKTDNVNVNDDIHDSYENWIHLSVASFLIFLFHVFFFLLAVAVLVRTVAPIFT